MSRSWLSRVVIAVIGLCLLIVAGLWTGAVLLERSLREPVNAYLKSKTETFLSQGNLQGLTITFPDLELSLTRRRLLIRDLKIRYDHRDSTRYTRFSASTPLITIEGLDIADVIWHRSFRLTSIRVSEPQITRLFESTASGKRKPAAAPVKSVDSTDQANDSTDQATQLSREVPPLDSLIYGLVAAWLPDDFRQGRIDAIGVDGAVLVLTSRQGSRVSRDSTSGLEFTIRGLGLDSARRRVFEGADLKADVLMHIRPGKSDSLGIRKIAFTLGGLDTVLTVGEFRTFPGRGQMGAYMAGFRRSRKAQSFSIDTVAVRPAETDSQFLRNPALRRTRIRLSASGILGTGVDFDKLLARRVEGGQVKIEKFTLDVLADRRVKGNPDAPVRSRTFLVQKLADLDWGLRLDTLKVVKGAMRYSELKSTWPTPATIWFSDISATLAGLSNRGGAAGPSHVVLRASATFLDTATVTMRMEVPIAKRFQLNAEGHAEHLPAAALNSFVTVSDGIQINSGRIDKADFQYVVADGHAQGTITAIYDSLSIALVDKETRKQNLGKKALSFLAKKAFVRGSNMPDKKGQVKSGKIDYDYKVGESFWGGVWRALRSGIISQVKK